MVDLGDYRRGIQVKQRDRLQIEQISNHFYPLFAYSCRNHIGFHVLSAACAQWLISPVLDQCQFACVGDHADARAGKIEFLIPSAFPEYFAALASFQINNNQGFVGIANSIPILVDIDFGDL